MALLGGTSLGGLAGGAATTRLLVVISGDSSQLTAAMAQAEGSVSGFAKNASSIGSAITRSVSLPALALSGVMTTLASSFDASLARVAALTPILDSTGLSIDQIGQQLIDFSNTVPTSAKDLADALYFAGSAGLNAATAMDVVEISAQGAAIGMGTAADISKVLVFALNNFQGAGLTATSAMDALTVAIQQGTAEPADLAIALGRLLPIAQEAGVTFQQVVGSVAQLTNLGLGARVATTSLRALFSELLAPTDAANEKLQELGITAQDVRDALVQGGPIEAFQLLEQATNGNIDALHDIIPQIRGFTAYLGLSGEQAKKAAGIFNEVQNSAGALKKAFDIVAATSPQFKFETALNQLKNAGIAIGQQMLPVFLRLAQVIGSFGQVLSSLPAPFQAVFAAMLLVAGAAGPLIKLFGVITNDGVGMFTSLKGTATAMLTMGLAAITAVGGFESLASGSRSVVSILTTAIGTFVAVKIALTGLQAAASATKLGGIVGALAGLSGGAITGIAIALGAIAVGIGLIIGKSHEFSNALHDAGTAMVEAAQAGETFNQFLQGIKDTQVSQDLREIAQSLNDLNVPTAKALPDILTKGIGTQLVGQLHSLQEQVSGSVPGFNDMVTAITRASASGQDLGAALNQAGYSSQQFFDILSGFSNNDFGDLGLTRSADAAKNLALEYGTVGDAIRKYQLETQATLAAQSLEAAGVQDLADKYGVSIPTIEQSLSNFGVTATGVGADVNETFGSMAGFAKSSASQTEAAMATAAKAVADHSEEIRQSLAESFSPLGEKIDTTLGKSVDQVIAQYQRMGTALAQESTNIVQLQQKGLPQGLVDQLIGDGPAAVAKFVNASDSQLKRLVGVYEFWLGASDDAVLAEGAHLEVKGKNNIEAFTTGMLTSSNLPQQAAFNIAKKVTTAVSSGDLQPAALDLISGFTKTLASQSHLSEAAAAKAVAAFANGLMQAKGNITNAGRAQVEQYAQGIAAASGLPKAKAAELVRQVIATFNENQSTKGAGQKVGADFTAGISLGIKSGTGAINAAAAKVTQIASGLGAAKNASSLGKQVGQSFASGLSSGAAGVAGAAKHLGQSVQAPLAASAKTASSSGKQVGSGYAKGVSAGSGAASAAGKHLGQASVAPLNSVQGAATAAGRGVGPAMAAGINAGAGAAVAAATALAARVKAAMALKGSPKVFTYYKGIELGKELGVGLDKGLRHLRPRRPALEPRLHHRGPHMGHGGRGNVTELHKHAHVRIDVHGRGGDDRQTGRAVADAVGVEIGKWMN